MSDSSPPRWPAPRQPVREPIFNVAPAVIGLVVVLLGIHLAVYQLVQSEATRDSILEAFAFIPARELAPAGFAGSEAARFWSPLSYAFLHADWTHVGVNVLWLVAFGSPLAWRFGSGRFLLFSAVGAVAGALAHFAIDPSDATGMVGASAAISAQMGGVIRFAFNGNTSLLGAPGGAAAYRMPALPLAQTLRNPTVVIFIVAWFGTNLIFGLFGAGAGISSGPIAWDAHVGGFIAGLLMFPVFDRAPRG